MYRGQAMSFSISHKFRELKKKKKALKASPSVGIITTSSIYLASTLARQAARYVIAMKF